ncbi:MAG: hypothetical protein GC185_12335 [Alphaproteobacteria bacterium]|nr:hypothetical protein [Alphaproteobacteria bacterium]
MQEESFRDVFEKECAAVQETEGVPVVRLYAEKLNAAFNRMRAEGFDVTAVFIPAGRYSFALAGAVRLDGLKFLLEVARDYSTRGRQGAKAAGVDYFYSISLKVMDLEVSGGHIVESGPAEEVFVSAAVDKAAKMMLAVKAKTDFCKAFNVANESSEASLQQKPLYRSPLKPGPQK